MDCGDCALAGVLEMVYELADKQSTDFMGGSFRVAQVAGIEVRIHVTFFLILLFYGWVFYAAGGVSGAVAGVFFVLLLFLCVLLHEFGHAFAARAFGIRTPDITLLPIGGVARLERMPRSPLQELVIALAGPAVNVAIAVLLFPLAASGFSPQDFGELDSASGGLAAKLLAVNIMLVLFNLIPAFPMDGGRILRSLLALAVPYATATTVAARVGQGFAVLFALAGLFGNPFLLIIAVFVFLGAQQELEASRLVERFGDMAVSDLMTTNFETISPRMSRTALGELLARQGQRVFPVVDDGMRVIGMARRDRLMPGDDGPAMHAAVRGVPLLPPAMPAMRALAIMRASGEPILPVVNASGQIVGLISAAALDPRPR